MKEMCRQSGLAAGTIRLYLDSGLIPGSRDTNGVRSFPPKAVGIARAVFATRMARVGRTPAVGSDA